MVHRPLTVLRINSGHLKDHETIAPSYKLGAFLRPKVGQKSHKTVRLLLRTVLGDTKSTRKDKNARFSFLLNSANRPHNVRECLRRKERRQVLFASGGVAKKNKKRKVFTNRSQTRC